MSTTPKRATKKKEEAKPHYTVTLTIADKSFTGEGETLVDALTALPKPEKMMLKGELTITDGEKRNSIHFTPYTMRRLFYNKSFLNIRVKSLMLGLR